MEQRLRLVQAAARADKRGAERRRMQVPGQIVWKDHRGQTRMASVVTRDVSEYGVSFECRTGLTVPLYRLVYFQVDRHVRNHPDLPGTLRRQNVLSAVFRVGDKGVVRRVTHFAGANVGLHGVAPDVVVLVQLRDVA